MAMKKKFLGLAMAAAIALPATSAYAAPVVIEDATKGTKTLQMDINETSDVTVPVTGSVTDKKGNLPQRIEVVLPSKMAFTVAENGDLIETTYDIENKSRNVDIKLSVDSFTGGSAVGANGAGNGIEVLDGTKFTNQGQDQLYRNQIKLSLSKIGTGEIDLGNCKNLDASDRELGTLPGGQIVKLKLSGAAGTKNVEDQHKNGNDVDSKGAQDNFNLVFSIKKA